MYSLMEEPRGDKSKIILGEQCFFSTAPNGEQCKTWNGGLSKVWWFDSYLQIASRTGTGLDRADNKLVARPGVKGPIKPREKPSIKKINQTNVRVSRQIIG